MDTKEKNITGELVVSVVTNVITSIIFLLVGFLINWFFSLNVPVPYMVFSVLALSALFTIFTLLRTYRNISLRLLHINFLREDSASQCFDIFIVIIKRIINNHDLKNHKLFERIIIPSMQELIEKRRQPMQIVEVDCKKIKAKFDECESPTSISERILTYLEFMAVYKRMAMPRIIRQANLYMETFGSNGITDYVVIYGHSTVVINSVISSYRNNPFPIIVVEDLQYNTQSLGEHKTTCAKLKNAGVAYTLIKFENIKELFDLSATRLPKLSGYSLPLMKKRRIHAFIGCERVDVQGNTLVPSESRGLPSETAQYIQEINTYASEKGSDNYTPARIVVFSESYKIRNFNKSCDINTHVPLRGRFIQSFLYVFGLRKKMPDLQGVSLFNIDASNVYTHINELGIFPNILGKFDLRYCEKVFENETSLLGLFYRPLFLRYKIFDEIKAVLFDLNGVIVDDEMVHFAAFVKVLNELGCEFNKDDYENLCLSRSDEDGFKLIKNKYKIDMSVEFLVDKKHQAYLESIAKACPPMTPGTENLLRELKNRGYNLCIVSASNREEVKVILNYLKIEHYFTHVITDDDVSVSKPAPEGYILAAKKLGVHPSRCIIVEDSPVNISYATEIGMHTIGIRSHGNSIENADYSFNSLEELLIA
jgi:beta-phosphoglucomutase